MRNGGFERGDEGWTVQRAGPPPPLPVEARVGRGAFLVWAQRADDAGTRAESRHQFEQIVELEEGAIYTLSAWVKPLTHPHRSGGGGLSLSGAAAPPVSVDLSDQALAQLGPPQANGWYQVRRDFRASAGRLTLRAGCEGNGRGDAYGVLIDEINIVRADTADAKPTFPVAPGSELVVWNTNNGKEGNSGTSALTISFFRGDVLVGALVGQALPWSWTEDLFRRFPVPAAAFDRIRVDITAWHHICGGLSEIQLLRGGRNVLVGAPARASGTYPEHQGPTAVTDGNTSSAVHQQGYWLLPGHTAGWVEVDVPKPGG